MKLNLGTICCILVFIFGCNRNQVSVDLDGSFSNSFPVDSIVDSLGFILLDDCDEALLMKEGRYSFAWGKTCFYVLDQFSDYSIRVFDYSGHFLKKINNQGDEEGMYKMAYDILEDESENLLVVLDPTGKIIRYTIADNYSFYDELRFKETLPAAHNIAFLSGGQYALYSRSAPNPLYISSFPQKRTNHLRYEVPAWLRLSPFMSSVSPFYVYRGKLFYFDSLCGDVYEVNETGLKPHLRWLFGNYHIHEKDITPNQSLKYYVKLLQKSSYRYAVPFYQVVESDNDVIACFMFRGQQCILIYDKENAIVHTLYRMTRGKRFPLGDIKEGAMYVPTQWKDVSLYVDEAHIPTNKTNNYVILYYSLK